MYVYVLYVWDEINIYYIVFCPNTITLVAVPYNYLMCSYIPDIGLMLVDK